MIGFTTVLQGERVAIWNAQGAVRFVDGPRRLVLFRERVEPLRLYSAESHQYLSVRFRDGRVEHVRGPISLWFHPVQHERMLDQTHDPIADFVNALSADVISFAAIRSFDKCKEDTHTLNELAAYPNLVGRAERIGYRVHKVVYRGYVASTALQTMHDKAIEARTKLQLEAETERQAQELADLAGKIFELPAGLVGDAADARDESFLLAAKRELWEETGYTAASWMQLCSGFSSPGLTDERVVLFLAQELTKIAAGGGDEREAITIHEAPLGDVLNWLEKRNAQADLKLLAGLYAAQQHLSKHSLLMTSQKLKEISKRLSYVLRHRPDSVGLELETGGWIAVDELLAALARTGKALSRDVLEVVVADNDKQRFEFNDDRTRIRARQGHSVEVELGYERATPPELLYHGTATRNRDSILEQGLLKGRRHHVHLSTNRETMIQVAMRHGKPLLFTIQAGQMHADGFEFFVTGNSVWLTDHIPPKYLAVCE